MNDFAKSINLSKQKLLKINSIDDYKTVYSDIGKFNTKCFNYVAAFGAFTKVSYSTPQKLKKVFGKLAYFIVAVKHLFKIKSYNIKVKYDEKEIEDRFIYGAISNSKSVAGLKWFDKETVKIDDGYFEILLIKKPRNLAHLIKIFYFPLLFVSLVCYYDDKKINICDIKNVFIINLLLYSFLLLIPLIFNTGYSTYTDFGLYGSIGWFYSANEISAILVLLFPFVYIFLRKKKILYVIIPILIVGIISSIGTKVSMFGVVIISLCVFIVLSREKINGFFNKRIVVCFSLIVFASSVFFLFSSNSLENLKIAYKVQQKQNIEEKLNFKNIFNRYMKALLSDRDIYIKDVYKVYKSNYSTETLFLGLGYMVDADGNIDSKMIEIDVLDIFFRYGVISVIIVLLPFVYYICCYLYKRKYNIRTLFYLFMIFLILGISFVAGHILLAPAVSIYSPDSVAWR